MIFLENEILYGHSFEVPTIDDFVAADRPRARSSAGQGRHDHGLLAAWSARRWQAAEQLAEEGIEAEVIDLRTLRPLDTTRSSSR